jgi:hypothetical protein
MQFLKIIMSRISPKNNERFFFQKLIVRKEGTRYFRALKNKYEKDDHEKF